MKKMLCPLCLISIFCIFAQFIYAGDDIRVAGTAKEMAVDFGYAFAQPHRLTVALPNSSDKTLVDVYPDYLRLKWSYENLLSKPLASFSMPETKWQVHLKITLDGQLLPVREWRRVEGWLPALAATWGDKDCTVQLQVVGGASAAIVRVEVQNQDTVPHQVMVMCTKPGRTAGYNPAWVQPQWDCDVLLAGWDDRADRIVAFMVGGDDHPVVGSTTMAQLWDLPAGENCVGWIVRPYQAYHQQLATLRNQDWDQQFEEGEQAWRQLIGKAAKISIPDPAVDAAFYAGLADCFIMREPMPGGYIAGTPGTEKYRAGSSGEPAIVAILLDQVGLHHQAALGLQMCLEQQGEDGCWADPKGWAHYMWGISGIKSWAVMEHYRLTGDKDFLAHVYPRMLASSRWQEQQRAGTRLTANGKRLLTFGLMPRGMGDCGLMDGDDLYGVFLPHNIWTVFADALTLRAAEVLGKESHLQELRCIYQTGYDDLLQALERGAIGEDGHRWIPGVAGKTCGSRWGALYAAYPCEILPRNHELINGTIRKIESNVSPGGIPVNTGWMKDGLWVAIALDNLAEVQLFRNEGDAAIKYLYATLNHGTPLFSWCEERGQEPGAKDCTGDLQHLWTPLAVSRFIRDVLVMEDDDTLHLARGTARQWLGSGRPIGVKGMVTHFGRVSYEVAYNQKEKLVAGYVQIYEGQIPKTVLHIRLPGGRKIKSLTCTGGGRVSADGTVIEWSNLEKVARFEARVIG